MIISATEDPDYLTRLPDVEDPSLDAARIRVFMAVHLMDTAEFEAYRWMISSAKDRRVWCADPQTALES